MCVECTNRRGSEDYLSAAGPLGLVAQFPAPLKGALPSHAVDLPGFVADDVPDAAAVDPAGRCTAAAGAAAAREAGVPVHGRHGGSHRGKPSG
ncbi:hypothetical protein GCM10010228_24720 [Streptomyces massasporeus]|nr:hypothetical protein GCM10010228_24720 [Streptomyces massasporeus]